MRLTIALLLVIVCSFLLVESSAGEARFTRRSNVARDYRRAMTRYSRRPHATLARSRRQSDECGTNCGTYLSSQDFAECSTEMGYVLSNDPKSATGFDSSNFCDTLDCSSILKTAFDCISLYCNGDQDPDSLAPVLKIISSSCKHDASERYCIDDYFSVERDASSDRNSINENFKECASSRDCNSDACVATTDYIDQTLGCCYFSFPEVMSSIESNFISTDFVKSCGKSGGTECAS